MASIRKILLIIPSSIIFFLLVPVFSIFFGRTLDVLLGLSTLDLGAATRLISIILLLVGGYYVIESIRILLAKGKGIPLGDIFPDDQTTELITTGIYAQTRNPMLFGYLLCLIAMGLELHSVSIAVIIPTGFIAIWTIWLKTYEEPALETRFGEPYREYKQKTPYLIPRPWRR
ncbi:MAG: isoprenylcysteine carboxylmethyltransferase family protein [Candidatus Bathyarchaeota archaeon]|nr:isoprenylcysteine carboxylmethyltransferase family protein [Candidatus Bathyarchaeota archaeon]